jgi:hypothetical protein
VPINTVAKTVEELFAKYPTFGGVADWEYFNTFPGGLNNPVKWGAIMAKAMETSVRSHRTTSEPAFSYCVNVTGGSVCPIQVYKLCVLGYTSVSAHDK